MSSDPRQYGDGQGEVIPSLDGTDFRQRERRVHLFVYNTRVVPARRAGKLVERLEGRAFDSCEGIQDLETPNGVENLLDHLRTHLGPVEVLPSLFTLQPLLHHPLLFLLLLLLKRSLQEVGDGGGVNAVTAGQQRHHKERCPGSHVTNRGCRYVRLRVQEDSWPRPRSRSLLSP